MPAMSQRQFAQHRGVSHAAVQKAIATGRISVLPSGKIDSDVADSQWEANTTAPDGDGPRLTKARLAYTVVKAKIADAQYKQIIGDLLPAADVRVASFNAARRFRDACQNIPSRCCGAIGGEVRRALEATGLAPDMVAKVTAKLSLVEIDNLLAAEIRVILTELSDGLIPGLTAGKPDFEQ